jgi:hypothetical protein
LSSLCVLTPSFFFTEASRLDGSKLCRNVLLIYIIRKCDFGVNLIFNNSSRTYNEISLTETLKFWWELYFVIFSRMQSASKS